jgi:hypothetical protein
MPYIKPEDRKHFDLVLLEFESALELHGCTPGELNYVISSLCSLYLKRKGEAYTYHNDILGVLEGVKQEWYRRKVAPYEDKKIVENGDVY